MNLLFWGLTVSLVGKVLLVAGVLLAHGKIAHEKRIDRAVIHSFKVEQVITLFGLLLVLIGYAMEISFYEFANLLTCEGPECAAMIEDILLPN